MLQFLGRLLARNPDRSPTLRYLSKAEGDPVWREGRLLAIDPHGIAFETRVDGRPVAECLPWGSIAAVQIPLDEEAADRRRGQRQGTGG